MRIDAHHHLWDLSAVHYPWLMARGVTRFFGDPTPIQRDYLLPEFRRDAAGFDGSVHIQVGAEDGLAEARWIQSVADANPDWPMVQVAFCDLTGDDLGTRLDALQALPSLRGVRQIVGRAPGEDAVTGTNALLADPRFVAGLREAGVRGLSFDLQLIPELYADMARVLEAAPDTKVALCHAGSPHDRTAAGIAAWARDLRRLADLPQVTCKLSGLGMFDHDWTTETIRPIVETCLDLFGPDRCMFGSNFPVDSLYSDYATLLAAHEEIVPEEMKPQVFGGTAGALYDFG
ncbi:amidohydrolase family protein [Ponticoccus sp. SC2-23]|uniref:amidohydrolase family protein n=1 Tax=Alexandriicola marinus TaxID=2081710 RepID=UPI000FD998CB|nr:amidohydrolase family protein [Alexandriicola marinus]MBM1221085.1 amidohydrolase family protein [Ponticoccus sp. SC6-9]MBM1225655.1 amidohydrolase family protein [Ponticoccus sp. SC6-15]MBM1227807.1 amidohydrolase family protein [Ponticoccus sp. SC6-38]MBM1234555.1 amidohydrolase family protein [Ponticoccus sp. SC6-45]MBM1238309.1 amidohydrolase family protein [Ponticoccus sp. SC6-49]MBM1243578.1 amidohydrolase family protein [Ponticoccus sp. SC2-64]MBM1248079.1 amidohydrolase family pro